MERPRVLIEALPVRDLLAAAKASPRLGLGTSLYDPLGLQPFLPHRFVSCTQAIAYPHYHIVLFHRLPCDICSACLLPTVHPGNTPHTTCLVKIVLNGRSSMRTLCPLYLVLTAIYIPKVGGVTLTAIRSCYSINTATRPVIGTEYVMRHLMRHTIAIKKVFSHTIRDN